MTPDLIKRLQQSWCWSCNRPSGRDCPDKARSRRAARKAARREWAREIRRDLEGTP